MDRPWMRWTLYLAAAWNLIGGATALVDPAKHFAQMYTTTLDVSDPLVLFFYRCVWINVIAWGIGYLLAARWPPTRKAILVAGGIGKVAYAAACIALFAGGIGKPMVLVAAAVDGLLAAAFAAIVAKSR